MGNYEEKKQINEEELKPYLKEGLTMNDLINLKKAFISLDKDENGKIEYDIRKITDIDKYDLPVKIEKNLEIMQLLMKVKLILLCVLFVLLKNNKIKNIKFINLLINDFW